MSQNQGQILFSCHSLPNISFCLFVFHLNMHKSQGHVKVTQYQGLKLKNQVEPLNCKCFCDLCVTRVVRLRPKGILVFFSDEKKKTGTLSCADTDLQDLFGFEKREEHYQYPGDILCVMFTVDILTPLLNISNWDDMLL